MDDRYLLAMIRIAEDEQNYVALRNAGLQKMMYEASRSCPEIKRIFHPDQYSVSNKKIQGTVKILEKKGLIRIEKSARKHNAILLTAVGQKFADKIIKESDAEVVQALMNVRLEFTKYVQRLDVLTEQMLKKQMLKEFKRNKYIIDNDCLDKNAHPFFKMLENTVAKNGKNAFEHIEYCIFQPALADYESVDRAIYFCGVYDDESTLDRRIDILTRVLFEHDDAVARCSAVKALGGLRRVDLLMKAYAAEDDDQVRYYMSRYYIVKNKIGEMMLDISRGNASSQIAAEQLFSVFYKSTYNPKIARSEIEKKVIDEIIRDYGLKKTADIVHLMAVHEFTPSSVSDTVAKLVKQHANTDLVEAFAQQMT